MLFGDQEKREKRFLQHVHQTKGTQGIAAAELSQRKNNKNGIATLIFQMVGPLGPLVGALDQGTSSTRFMVFAAETSQLVTYHQVQVELKSPQQGWEELDPQELLESSITCINSTVDKLNKMSVDPADIVSIGVTNQRETVVVWVSHRQGCELAGSYCIIAGPADREQSVPSHSVVRPEDQGPGHLP